MFYKKWYPISRCVLIILILYDKPIVCVFFRGEVSGCVLMNLLQKDKFDKAQSIHFTLKYGLMQKNSNLFLFQTLQHKYSIS